MKYEIRFDSEKCVACGACTIACIDQNDIEVKHGEEPFRKVFTEEDVSEGTLKFKYIMKSCMHCSDAPCKEACPFGCIEIDKETGFVVYDDSACVGCGLCAKACKYDAISYSKDKKIRKCDGCFIRVQHGMEPACVRNCLTKALTLHVKE